ncbi:MAG: aldo/keto reductase [Planctomycetota bacterium]
MQSSQMRKLGKSDIFVTPVGMGCWPIAGMTSLEVNDRDSLATLHAAIDSGINFFDNAHCYGVSGESEKLLGQAIAGKRDEVVIATKGGIHWDANGVRHYDGTPPRLILECEESLRRMQIDVIDLYYLHAPDPTVPVESSAEAFLKLAQSGKIRTVGVSNFSLDQLQDFHQVCPVTAIQPPFNMLQREIESDVIPWCVEHQISVVNYWPLMKGLLAGKIRRGHVFDPADKRLTYAIFQGEAFERAQCLLDYLDQIALETGRTVAQVVVNWTYSQFGITSTLCGAKRDWQIQDSAGAMGWELDSASLQKIDDFLKADVMQASVDAENDD